MKLAIITHVEHIQQEKHYFAYSPYVREMNIWGKYADHLHIVAPFNHVSVSAMHLYYQHQKITFQEVESISLTSFKNSRKALVAIPKISWRIYKAMHQADHIHLRCPGNMGLLGALIQMAFPNKPKTAKYAGNWDPESKQPWSYSLQKWILNNTFLTRKMQVLVYGNWPNQSKNIKPFFTATYSKEDKLQFFAKDFKSQTQFIFVGTLVKGKNPLYAIQLVEALIKKGHQVALSLYGEGVERESLQKYIFKNNLESNIILKGNQNQEVIKNAYQESHFVILPSKSEGWPKAIAEGMFWGCVPLATSISCVPFMLDYGKRGLLLETNIDNDLKQIELLLQNQSLFNSKSTAASTWSRKYTVDVFEQQIEQFLLQK